jgi:hypothetical protein
MEARDEKDVLVTALLSILLCIHPSASYENENHSHYRYTGVVDPNSERTGTNKSGLFHCARHD